MANPNRAKNSGDPGVLAPRPSLDVFALHRHLCVRVLVLVRVCVLVCVGVCVGRSVAQWSRLGIYSTVLVLLKRLAVRTPGRVPGESFLGGHQQTHTKNSVGPAEMYRIRG